MSEALDRLQAAVNAWHEQARKSLTAEADFLEKIKPSLDDVVLAETTSATRYTDLIAETIEELLG